VFSSVWRFGLACAGAVWCGHFCADGCVGALLFAGCCLLLLKLCALCADLLLPSLFVRHTHNRGIGQRVVDGLDVPVLD
jgi:hypothetical protein